MKLNMKRLSILLPVGVILCAAGAFAAIPSLRHHFIKAPQVEAMKEKEPVMDKKQQAILAELSSLAHRLDTMTVFTVTGTIQADDLADSSNRMHTDFCYSRNGNVAYYKLGSQEMISLEDAYITVAHDVKKILLSPAREAENPVRMPFKMEADAVAKEGYQVTKTLNGDIAQISLRRDNHISCREYRLTFDTTGLFRQSNIRLTDQMAPANRDRDKLIEMKISSWQPGKARTELMQASRYLTTRNGEPTPAAALAGYEIIRYH